MIQRPSMPACAVRLQPERLLRIVRRPGTNARIVQQFLQPCAAVAPLMEQVLAQQGVVPGASVAMLGRQRVDAFTPGHRRT